MPTFECPTCDKRLVVDTAISGRRLSLRVDEHQLSDSEVVDLGCDERDEAVVEFPFRSGEVSGREIVDQFLSVAHRTVGREPDHHIGEAPVSVADTFVDQIGRCR